MVQNIVPQLQSVRIRKLGIISVANMSALTGFFFGLIGGIIFFVVSFFVIPTTTGVSEVDLALGSLMGGLRVLLLIGMPVFCAIVGWISGAIGALIYNLSAKIGKGVVLYSQ